MIKRKTFYIKRKRKKRKKKIDLWRAWGVPDGAYRRYQGLRGIYWYWLSRDVRRSEWEKWKGLCLTCLKPIADWREGQCGHVIPSSKCGEYLRFHRKNLTIQHPSCNNPRITPHAGLLNGIHYNQRHGEGAIEALMEQVKIKAKEPTKEKYEKLIRSLKSYQEYAKTP